jgi:hypothetical protein
VRHRDLRRVKREENVEDKEEPGREGEDRGRENLVTILGQREQSNSM